MSHAFSTRSVADGSPGTWSWIAALAASISLSFVAVLVVGHALPAIIIGLLAASISVQFLVGSPLIWPALMLCVAAVSETVFFDVADPNIALTFLACTLACQVAVVEDRCRHHPVLSHQKPLWLGVLRVLTWTASTIAGFYAVVAYLNPPF